MRSFHSLMLGLLSLGWMVQENTLAESWRPLRTEGLQTLTFGQVEADLAIEYRDSTVFPFTRRADQPERDELQAPRVGLNVGMAERVDLQLDYAYLFIDEAAPGVGDESGSGDLSVFTKWRVMDQSGHRPALGLRLGAKLPNADDQKRLGTDQTDFFGALLAEYSTERFSLAANVGLAILENPNAFTVQDDVLTYALGGICRIAENLDFAADLSGIGLSRSDNDESSLLGALRYKLGPVRFYLGGSVGLSDRAEDFGIVGGLTYGLKD